MLAYLLLLGIVGCACGRHQDQDLNLIKDSLCNPGYFDQLIPHEKDCDKFYSCQFGLRSLEPLECPSSTEFSVSYRACVPPALSNCKSARTTTAPSSALPKDFAAEDVLPNGCPKDFDIHLLLPHNTKLNKFYFCIHGELEEIICAGSTVFNSENQVCDWPENMKHSSAEINVISRSKTSKNLGDKGDGSGSHNGHSVHGGEGGCSCGQGGDNSGEAGDHGGNEGNIDDRCHNECYVPHWSHETDCDKFWRCQANQKVLGVCSDGLHFNLATQTCDLISKVNCERKYVQSTAQSNGLKLFLPWNEVDKFVKRSKSS